MSRLSNSRRAANERDTGLRRLNALTAAVAAAGLVGTGVVAVATATETDRAKAATPPVTSPTQHAGASQDGEGGTDTTPQSGAGQPDISQPPQPPSSAPAPPPQPAPPPAAVSSGS